MYRFPSFVILALAPFISSSNAVTLTLENVPHQRAFDVIWGPSAPLDLQGPDAKAQVGDLSSIVATDTGSGVTISYYQFSGVGYWFTGGLSFDFASDTSREFVMPTAIPAGFFFGGRLDVPTSVTPIAGGFGAHVVYDHRALVPDSGSGASMLVLGIAACVTLWPRCKFTRRRC